MTTKGFVIFFLLLNCVYNANTSEVIKPKETALQPRAFSISSVWQTVQNVFSGIKQFIMTAFSYVKSIISSGMSLATGRKDRMLDGFFENLPVLNWAKKLGPTLKTTTAKPNVTKTTTKPANVGGTTAGASLQESASNNNGNNEYAPGNYDSITQGLEEQNYNDNDNSEGDRDNYSDNNYENEENDDNDDAETRSNFGNEDGEGDNEENNYNNNNDYNDNDNNDY